MKHLQIFFHKTKNRLIVILFPCLIMIIGLLLISIWLYITTMFVFFLLLGLMMLADSKNDKEKWRKIMREPNPDCATRKVITEKIIPQELPLSFYTPN